MHTHTHTYTQIHKTHNLTHIFTHKKNPKYTTNTERSILHNFFATDSLLALQKIKGLLKIIAILIGVTWTVEREREIGCCGYFYFELRPIFQLTSIITLNTL